MNTKDKLEELKDISDAAEAARNAHDAKVDATRDARAVAFEVFLAADSDFYAALKALNSATYYEEKD